MQLSKLRRGNWMVIGAVVGLIFGWSINAVGTDAVVIGARAPKTSQITFESELLAPPLKGADGSDKPFIADLTVFPDGPVDLLKMRRLANLQPNAGPNSRMWGYQTWFFEARRPYSPLVGAPRTDVFIKPDFAADGYQADDAWNNADGVGKLYRDPGPHGARLFLDLAKGNYDVAIRLDDPQEAATLTATFNDHPLAPFTVDQADSRWVHSAVPAADFGQGTSCILGLGRGDVPVHIRQIHMYDRAYTVRDYLNAMQSAHPQIEHYRYAWWMEPKAVLWISVGICVFVIGIIWPTVIRIIAGAK